MPHLVRLNDHAEAQTVAEEMATKHGREFFVLQATDRYTPPIAAQHDVLVDYGKDTPARMREGD